MANRWVWIIKAVASAIIFACTLMSIFTLGPAVETRLFPVVSKLNLLSVEREGDNTLVKADFTKLRPCEYIGITWFRHTLAPDGADLEQRIPVILRRDPDDTSSPNRPLGRTIAGPWELVGVTPEQVKGESVALLYHRCHPFWTTTTEFYP